MSWGCFRIAKAAQIAENKESSSFKLHRECVDSDEDDAGGDLFLCFVLKPSNWFAITNWRKEFPMADSHQSKFLFSDPTPPPPSPSHHRSL